MNFACLDNSPRERSPAAFARYREHHTVAAQIPPPYPGLIAAWRNPEHVVVCEWPVGKRGNAADRARMIRYPTLN